MPVAHRCRISAALILALCLCGPLAAETEKPCPILDVSVSTPMGKICGKWELAADLKPARAFYGIPYASSGRWQAPAVLGTLPADPFIATRPGHFCPQPVVGKSNACPLPSTQSEDCLNLNVWAPKSGSNLPVLVFIHGGAFLTGKGSSPMYNGTHMATRGDVVVVTFNYRLGSFGYLALPGFTGTDQNNFGFRDQIAALQWVQNNISSFGGDLTKVTVFGESAGAMSVGLHMLSSSQSGNLFRAAAMESNPLGVSYKSLQDAQASGTSFAKSAGCSTDPVTCMKNLGTCELVNAESKFLKTNPLFSSLTLPWAPVVDGSLITGQPIAAAGTLKYPLLMGSNANEGTLFAFLYSNGKPVPPAAYASALTKIFGAANAKKVTSFKTSSSVKPYNCPSSVSDCKNQLRAVMNDYLFSCSNRFLARQSPQPLFAYMYAHKSGYCNPWGVLLPACGKEACHGAELPYVFHTPSSIDGCKFWKDGEMLSEAMIDYWTSFATNLTPTTDAKKWPSSWSSFKSSSTYMVLDGNPSSTQTDPVNTSGSPYMANCQELWDGIGYESAASLDRLLAGIK